jgi:hypothetical protein
MRTSSEGRTDFITDHATILDWTAKKGGEFRVLRKGSSEWTCLPGPPPGATHDEPGCFDKVFFQWATDGLAGRPQHIERLGVAYMYTGALLAKKYRKTPAQIILRWQIELGTSPKNIDIFDFAPTSEEVRAINALDTGERGGPDPEQVNPQTFSITIQD